MPDQIHSSHERSMQSGMPPSATKRRVSTRSYREAKGRSVALTFNSAKAWRASTSDRASFVSPTNNVFPSADSATTSISIAMKRHPAVRPAPRPADGSCQCGDVHIRKRVHPRPARGTVPAVDARQCDPESPCKDNSKSVLFRTRIILAEARLCVNQHPSRTFSKARRASASRPQMTRRFAWSRMGQSSGRTGRGGRFGARERRLRVGHAGSIRLWGLGAQLDSRRLPSIPVDGGRRKSR